PATNVPLSSLRDVASTVRNHSASPGSSGTLKADEFSSTRYLPNSSPWAARPFASLSWAWRMVAGLGTRKSGEDFEQQVDLAGGVVLREPETQRTAAIGQAKPLYQHLPIVVAVPD